MHEGPLCLVPFCDIARTTCKDVLEPSSALDKHTAEVYLRLICDALPF